MHVFADLQPYICTFEPCEKKLIKFPTRKMWAEHEFSEHRALRSWCCPECTESFSAARDLEVHLRLQHLQAFTPAQLPRVLAAAETRSSLPIKTQECPLCKTIPGTSQRNFVKHVGRHLEAIALATLPRETDDDSEHGSVASSDGSQPVTGLAPLPSPPFFVPPDFCRRMGLLAGRGWELEQLDRKLFQERRPHGTTSVFIYGEPGSGKTELVERYIELNGMKFTGGVFWINYRSTEEVHNVLRCIALEYMKNYSPGPDVALETLLLAVRTWFEGFDNWLLVLNDLPDRWGFQGLFVGPIFCPNRQQSSLIYISSSDQIQGSSLPLEPKGLKIFPLNETKHPSPELNLQRRPMGGDQTSATELGSIRQTLSGSGTIRPYTCPQPECINLQGFTHADGLRGHERRVHLMWDSNEEVTRTMPPRPNSGQSRKTDVHKCSKCSKVFKRESDLVYVELFLHSFLPFPG